MAQQIVKHSSKFNSIYTFTLSAEKNNATQLNKKLKLTHFNFVFVKDEDIDNGIFTLPFNSLGKKPSKFIYDDYNNYNTTYFLKGFFKQHDPTRWLPSQQKLQ